MLNKFNLSWLKFAVGSTSLFYIASASVLSCFIIYYFISGLLAFLILCGIIFGERLQFQDIKSSDHELIMRKFSFRRLLLNPRQFTLLSRCRAPPCMRFIARNLHVAIRSRLHQDPRPGLFTLLLYTTSRAKRKLCSNVCVLPRKRRQYRWPTSKLLRNLPQSTM